MASTGAGAGAAARAQAAAAQETIEVIAGELETYQGLYWELRSVMDELRARLNVGDEVSDRAAVVRVPMAARAVALQLPPLAVPQAPGAAVEPLAMN